MLVNIGKSNQKRRMPDFIIQLCALVRIARLSVRCEVQKYGNELKNDFFWKRVHFFLKKGLQCRKSCAMLPPHTASAAVAQG